MGSRYAMAVCMLVGAGACLQTAGLMNGAAAAAALVITSALPRTYTCGGSLFCR
jgi:hypothetical protein